MPGPYRRDQGRGLKAEIRFVGRVLAHAVEVPTGSAVRRWGGIGPYFFVWATMPL